MKKVTKHIKALAIVKLYGIYFLKRAKSLKVFIVMEKAEGDIDSLIK